MAQVNVRPSEGIPLQVVLPSGETEWPGPVSWTPSDPEVAVVALSDDTQMAAVLVLNPDQRCTVTVDSGDWVGTSDEFVAVDDADPNITHQIQMTSGG